jgi:hypothetical protein
VRGLEPPTFRSTDSEPSVASGNGKGLAASAPSACTSACTSDPKTVHASTVEDLARTLSGLSSDDRARLAALLLELEPR